jgi:hypothetical protein
MKVKKERNTSMETIGIKLEEDRIMKQTCDMKVKVESQFPGAKASLTELPTAKEQLMLEKHQMVKRLFNSEVNLVSDWVLEHRLKNLSNKIYKRRTIKKIP